MIESSPSIAASTKITAFQNSKGGDPLQYGNLCKSFNIMSCFYGSIKRILVIVVELSKSIYSCSLHCALLKKLCD